RAPEYAAFANAGAQCALWRDLRVREKEKVNSLELETVVFSLATVDSIYDVVRNLMKCHELVALSWDKVDARPVRVAVGELRRFVEFDWRRGYSVGRARQSDQCF